MIGRLEDAQLIFSSMTSLSHQVTVVTYINLVMVVHICDKELNWDLKVLSERNSPHFVLLFKHRSSKMRPLKRSPSSSLSHYVSIIMRTRVEITATKLDSNDVERRFSNWGSAK